MQIKAMSLVIPAYNEEKAIAKTISEAKSALSDNLEEFEIIVVDDCSSDSTAEIAESSGVKVLKQPVNMGYGNALKAGIKAAEYDFVGICDADGTYNLSEFSKLIPCAVDYDMVVGARTGNEFYGQGLKRIARWFQLKLVNFTTGNKIPDANSGMRIFNKESISRFLESLCGTFSFTTSITLAMFSTGMKVKHIEVSYNPRIGTSHVRLIRDTLRSLQVLIQATVLYNPIKAFLTLSIIPFTLFFLFIISAFGALLAVNRLWLLFSLSFSFISLYFCVLLLAFGMLAYAYHRS